MASWSVRSWHPNIYFEFCTSLSISSVGLCRFVKESWENSKACLFPGWPLRKFLFFIRRHSLCFSSRRSWQRLSEDFQSLSLDTAVWAIVPLLGWCLQRLVFHQFIMWYKGDESAVLYWTSCGLWASYSYLKTLCTISFSPLYLWESPQPSSKKGWFSSLGLCFAVFLPRHSFVKVLASGLLQDLKCLPSEHCSGFWKIHLPSMEGLENPYVMMVQLCRPRPHSTATWRSGLTIFLLIVLVNPSYPSS